MWVEDCGRDQKTKGFCRVHYQRKLKGTDLYSPVRTPEKHGKWGSREYKTWDMMIQRCSNPKHTNYKYYGARGITVCDRWLRSFKSFYDDMGDRPQGMTLDRKDVNKGYYKDNCRWATRTLQSINQRPQKNSSGYAGIYSSGSKWAARFREKYIGLYPSKQQASEAYQDARNKYLEGLKNV